jgi:glycosyltransferase involved in cell wall biosynthesis
MNIIYLSNSFIPSRTANSIHVMKMCQAIAKVGHRVTLLARKGKNDEKIDNIFEFYGVDKCFEIKTISFIEGIKGKTYLFVLIASFLSKKGNPNLVLSRSILGAYLCALMRIKVILEVHAPISNDNSYINKYGFFRLIKSKYFHKLIVISGFLKNLYEQKYFNLIDKIQVCHDGADPIPDNTEAILRAQSTDSLMVGYIGHLYKGRGIDIIFKMASIIENAEFHIIGGSLEDIEYWRAQSKGKDNIFIHGFVEPGKVYNYIKSFDVLLAPYEHKVSISGGAGNTVQWMSPLKIFEYMSSGKIILASRLPALAEILTENSSCLMAEPGNVDEWVEKIKLIRLKHENYIHLGLRAQLVFNQEYTWINRAKKILN